MINNEKATHLLQMSLELLTNFVNETNDQQDEIDAEIYIELISDFLKNN